MVPFNSPDGDRAYFGISPTLSQPSFKYNFSALLPVSVSKTNVSIPVEKAYSSATFTSFEAIPFPLNLGSTNSFCTSPTNSEQRYPSPIVNYRPSNCYQKNAFMILDSNQS